jgi:putative phosphoribosyl transferase
METKEISIPVNDLRLKASLNVPSDPTSLIIFSLGSANGRFIPRNLQVAQQLNQSGAATLLIDLLAPVEDKEMINRFNVDLLADRLVIATAYIMELKELRELPVGFFGASTGAASALQASARLGKKVRTVVTRGGRPDLVKKPERIRVPVLMIVGSLDKEVLALNRATGVKLTCENQLQVVEGASHLFEETGKLEIVADLAKGWFKEHLLKSDQKIYAV